MIGSTILHYRIKAELGRGGMGIVYRAEDTKLDRTVALKVLPPHALSSEDDRARFYREARAAAKLNHAHIATVYEIGEAAIVPEGEDPGRVASSTGADVRPFIAMEFVDGESLAERVAKGPMKLDECVRLATQVASALGAAHDAGVVHRDVKSGNIMLTAKGEAKVLDFGLAKTAASTQLTRQGSTLGTVAYMSPEQARGEEVDGRTDLWALGVVLYEMVAGRLPFQADYEQAALYGILNEDPEPLTAVRTGVPMELEAVVMKLLRKEARLRYQSAAGLIADLDAISIARTTSQRSAAAMPAAGPSTAGGSSDGTVLSKRWRIYALWFGVAGLLIGALSTAALLRSSSTTARGEVVRASIDLPDEYPLQFLSRGRLGVEINSLDLASDGSRLVYVADMGESSRLVIRDMRDGTVRPLEETDDAFNPSFSPDDLWIAYQTSSGIFRISVEGGRPEFVTQTTESLGIMWARDGSIYVADIQGTELARISPDGNREALTSAGRCDCGLPADGREEDRIVVSGRDREVVVAFRADGTRDTLAIRGNHVNFLPGGQVVYTRTGRLLASLWNPASGTIGTESRVLLEDLRTGSILRSGHYSVSDAGTLVYASGQPSGLVDLVIREADGTDLGLPMPSGVYGPLSISPDHTRLLVTDYDRGGQTVMVDLERSRNQVIVPDALSGSAIWSADGRRVTYTRLTDGQYYELWQVDPARPSGGELLVRDSVGVRANAWSPDGEWLAYTAARVGRQIILHNMADGTDYRVPNPEGETLWAADFSRDGGLLAYTRVGSGGSSIYVDTVPGSGNPVAIASGGAEEPEWLPDEDAFVYRQGNSWYITELLDAATLRFSEPRVLFRGPYVNIAGMEYRVLPGRRAVLQRSGNTATTAGRIEVITGFDRMIDEAFE